ncbi:MAG: hypothetical protein L0Y74_00910 [candidate division Zixibacteria bacterium]|nr:hypothetical protein [candidate division Zixibacteria bacterium]
MKRLILLFGFAVTLILAGLVLAEIPRLINFQGMLRDGGGNPITDGTYTVRFRIYGDSTTAESNYLWSETVPVQTSGGLFTVRLGNDTVLPDSLFTGSNQFVGVKVNVDPEMPRVRLVSTGYAFQALRSDTAAVASLSMDLACNGCVNAVDLATNSVGAAEISAGAVGTSEIDSTQVQRRVTGTAPGGEYITAINGDGSVATAVDQVGVAGGWTDDGAAVRLTTATDLVGIGTSAPLGLLHLKGNNFKQLLESTGNADLVIGRADTTRYGNFILWLTGTPALAPIIAGQSVCATGIPSCTCTAKPTAPM